jgi:LysR family transcriptional activator of nhaA
LSPRLLGEFDDSAMVMTLGQLGLGVFTAPLVLDAEVRAPSDVVLLGEVPELVESFYVITVERRLSHPGVLAITAAARAGLFAAWNR